MGEGETMIDSIQGSAAIGSHMPVNSPTGTTRVKKATPTEAVDYNISLNKEIVSTLTYERTGSIGSQSRNDTESVEGLLSRLFERQGITYEEAIGGKAVEIDPQTRSEAQALISEDGYWGVNKTSDRIFEFAVASAGGEPTKLEAIKAAIGKGFGMAATSFGGSLPEISSKTYDAIMQKLDAWANEQA
jgi:hypothetical protein